MINEIIRHRKRFFNVHQGGWNAAKDEENGGEIL
jgi:hypothetical protein